MLTMTDSDANYGSSEAEADSDDSLASQATDARLVEQARHGDTDAFGELVQRYERRVIKVIRRFMPDQEMVLDLAQDAFLKAFDRLDEITQCRWLQTGRMPEC